MNRQWKPTSPQRGLDSAQPESGNEKRPLEPKKKSYKRKISERAGKTLWEQEIRECICVHGGVSCVWLHFLHSLDEWFSSEKGFHQPQPTRYNPCCHRKVQVGFPFSYYSLFIPCFFYWLWRAGSFHLTLVDRMLGWNSYTYETFTSYQPKFRHNVNSKNTFVVLWSAKNCADLGLDWIYHWKCCQKNEGYSHINKEILTFYS